jgi:dipeptidyl aminopeptidase/acylaminoacyl peptidase
MRKALEDSGKPPEWFALSGEGHGAYDETNRRAVYERVLEFLQQHLSTTAVPQTTVGRSSGD